MPWPGPSSSRATATCSSSTPARSPDPQHPGQQRGAAFVIHFGIAWDADVRKDNPRRADAEIPGPVWIPKLLIVADEDRQRNAIIRVAHDIEITLDHMTVAEDESGAEDCIRGYKYDLAIVDIYLSKPANKEEGLRIIPQVAPGPARVPHHRADDERGPEGARGDQAAGHDRRGDRLRGHERQRELGPGAERPPSPVENGPPGASSARPPKRREPGSGLTSVVGESHP